MAVNAHLSDQPAVLTLAYYFPPDNGSGSLRNLGVLKNVPANGWKLHVIAPDGRYFPHGGENGLALLNKLPENVDVHRTKFFHVQKFIIGFKNKGGGKSSTTSGKTSIRKTKADQPQSRSLFQRLKDFITDLVSIPDKQVGWLPYAYRAGDDVLKHNRIDVIYAIGKPWTGFFAAYLLKRKYKLPLVIDFMDPWQANLWTEKKEAGLEKIQSMLEKFIVRRSDFVIANTEESRLDFVERLKVDDDATGIVSCGYDKADFTKMVQAGKNDVLTITHTGTFYKNRNPLNFLKALNELIDENKIEASKVKANFIGRNDVDSPELDSLLQTERMQQIVNNVAWVEHHKAIEYLYNADVLLLIQPDTQLQIPAKLYEYIVTGKQILALSQSDGAVANIIRREGWGNATDGEDIPAIKAAIEDFYNTFYAGKLNTGARSYDPEKYEYGTLARNLVGILEKLSGNNVQQTAVTE